MAPSFAIPRLLARHGLRYDDIVLWDMPSGSLAIVSVCADGCHSTVTLLRRP